MGVAHHVINCSDALLQHHQSLQRILNPASLRYDKVRQSVTSIAKHSKA
jgi:hypothetical protein